MTPEAEVGQYGARPGTFTPYADIIQGSEVVREPPERVIYLVGGPANGSRVKLRVHALPLVYDVDEEAKSLASLTLLERARIESVMNRAHRRYSYGLALKTMPVSCDFGQFIPFQREGIDAVYVLSGDAWIE